jgi:hypothetical protein
MYNRNKTFLQLFYTHKICKNVRTYSTIYSSNLNPKVQSSRFFNCE